MMMMMIMEFGVSVMRGCLPAGLTSLPVSSRHVNDSWTAALCRNMSSMYRATLVQLPWYTKLFYTCQFTLTGQYS